MIRKGTVMFKRSDKETAAKVARLLKKVSVFLVLALVFNTVTVLAATEPTYKYTEETKDAKAFVIKLTTAVKLRATPETNAKQLTHPLTNEKMVIAKGDLVAVMSEEAITNSNGELEIWYEVRYIEDDIEFHGFVNSIYTEKTGDPAFPLPTPTPVVTNTPTPTPSTAPSNTPTPTNTATPTLPPPSIEKDIQDAPSWIAPVVMITAIVAFFALFGLYCLFTYLFGKRSEEGESDMSARQIREQRRAERAYAAEIAKAKEEAEKSRKNAIESAARETENIRQELDELLEGEDVMHKFFGEGMVIDNSDLDNIVVKFADETRRIDKDNAAAKKLMRKL